MCVLALAWKASPRWRLVLAGNRDERHDRAALPLARWDDIGGVIAGRDCAAGGTWLGVHDAGRLAVVTNVRDVAGPDPTLLSRGGLVVDALTGGLQALEPPEAYNAFNLLAIDGDAAAFVSNRPDPVQHVLPAGVHGLSNGEREAPWPKTHRLIAAVAEWAEGDEPVERLFVVLREEDRFGGAENGAPIFIRNPVYGTRCSTVVTVDWEGRGVMIERRFDASGEDAGETRIDFAWPVIA